ncbi:MAG: class Ib ribonucleoside-diphosphate reductase assembly flavoprotein NrdI [Sporolactobacillus sp.]
MQIYYSTMTGNVRRFLRKTQLPCQSIQTVDAVVEPYVLVTNTVGFGEVPETVKRFLGRHSRYLVAVAASGNRNWGKNFAKAADVIAQAYGVPVLSKFELGGTAADVIKFKERVTAYDEAGNQSKIIH